MAEKEEKMNEMTVRDGNHLPSKAVLGSYVHDAAEMEFDLLTLEKSREELKEKILGERSRNIRKEMGSFVPKQHLEKKPLQHEVLENTSSLKLPEKDDGAEFIQKLFEGGIVSAVLALIISFIAAFVRAGRDDDFELTFLGVKLLGIFLVITLLIVIIITVVNNISVENERAEKIASHHREISSKNEKIRRENAATENYNTKTLPRLNAAIDEENRQGAELHEQKILAATAEHDRLLAMLDQQYRELENAIEKAKAQRAKFYSVNIIPMDYRTIECTFFLDHSFRNDLVDTVRQGIERYELSEYRNSVLGGLQTIANSLGNLTGLMLDLGNRINSIQNQVSVMSNDVYRMTERQARMQSEMDDNNRRVLEESRLQRYATESLNRNAEKIVKYCETGSTD